MASVTVTDTKMMNEVWVRNDDWCPSPPTTSTGAIPKNFGDTTDQGNLPVDKECEAKTHPFAMKVRAAKGIQTCRINDAKRRITDICIREPEMPTHSYNQDLKQHLNEIRPARESIGTAYTNIMWVDVPVMAETYEKNMHEQLDTSLDFERQRKATERPATSSKHQKPLWIHEHQGLMSCDLGYHSQDLHL